MPGNVSGPFSDPSRGDSEQRLRTRVARLEAQQEMLARALAELTAQLAEEVQAAAVPDRPRPHRRPRRGDTFLWVVKAVAIAAAGMGVILAAMAPVRAQQQRYSPRCTASCSRPGERREAMIVASFIISGFAIVVSGVSMWLSRISSKIRRGKPLTRLECRVAGRITGT